MSEQLRRWVTGHWALRSAVARERSVQPARAVASEVEMHRETAASERLPKTRWRVSTKTPTRFAESASPSVLLVTPRLDRRRRARIRPPFLPSRRPA